MQETGFIKFSLKISHHLKACSTSFSKSTECFIPALHPGVLSRMC